MKIEKSQFTLKQRWLLAVVVICSMRATAQSAAPKSFTTRQVVVSIPDRKLAILENGQVLRVFPVSVGAGSSPSPRGDFHIINRITNPTYYRSGTVIPAGPDNPIGPRWLGLDRKGYGIHGTNEPRSIGKAASHGCIRLRNRDIEQFFTLVRVGDPVHIADQRDKQVAQVFGDRVVTVAEVQSEGGSQNAGAQ